MGTCKSIKTPSLCPTGCIFQALVGHLACAVLVTSIKHESRHLIILEDSKWLGGRKFLSYGMDSVWFPTIVGLLLSSAKWVIAQIRWSFITHLPHHGHETIKSNTALFEMGAQTTELHIDFANWFFSYSFNLLQESWNLSSLLSRNRSNLPPS